MVNFYCTTNYPVRRKTQIPLRRLCGQVRETDTNHESLRHKSCRWLSWFVSTTFPAGKFRSKSASWNLGLNADITADDFLCSRSTVGLHFFLGKTAERRFKKQIFVKVHTNNPNFQSLRSVQATRWSTSDRTSQWTAWCLTHGAPRALIGTSTSPSQPSTASCIPASPARSVPTTPSTAPPWTSTWLASQWSGCAICWRWAWRMPPSTMSDCILACDLTTSPNGNQPAALPPSE